MDTQQRFDNWAFHALTDEEKLAFIKNYLVFPILEVSQNQDRVDEVVVPESMVQVTSDALKDMDFPSDLPEPDPKPLGYSREVLETQFKQFCAEAITVRGAPVEQFMLPEESYDTVSEPQQFIRLVTMRGKETSFLQAWDNAIGFTGSLRAKGCPLVPTNAERRLMFLLLHVLEQLGQAQENKITPATSADLMFTP